MYVSSFGASANATKSCWPIVQYTSSFAPSFDASPLTCSARFVVSFTVRIPWSVQFPKMM